MKFIVESTQIWYWGGSGQDKCWPLSEDARHVYTDGSGGSSNAIQSAGWGVTIYRPEQGVEANVRGAANRLDAINLFGPVITERNSEFYMGAARRTNNTGELTVIGAALQYVTQFGAQWREIVIYYDSKYAAKMGSGEWLPTENCELIENFQRMVEKALENTTIDWRGVKGHSEITGNKQADFNANRGAVGEWSLHRTTNFSTSW